MTCGVYGLVCPDTGSIVYVGTSEDIEGVHARYQFSKSWRHMPKGPQVDWAIRLKHEGKKPGMEVLEVCNVSEFATAKTAWVSALRKTGEAMFNG